MQENINEDKVTSYLKNANDFLWGVFDNAKDYSYDDNKRKGLEINGHRYGIWQGEIYNRIQDILGKDAFPFSEDHRKPYDEVTKYLIKTLTIKGILQKIILPDQAEILGSHEINFLRQCWKDGTRPSTASILNYERLVLQNKTSIDIVHLYVTNFVEFHSTKAQDLSLTKGWSQWAFVYLGLLDEDPEMRIENNIREKKK